MARSADVILEWADGEYLFRLAGAQIEALEAECPNPDTGKDGIGFGAIWQRVMDGRWYYRDLRNVIRHGLIGGGMGAVEANRMCRDYIDAMPTPLAGMPPGPDSPVSVAQAVLMAAVVGVAPRDDAEPADEAALAEPRDFGELRALLLDFGVDPKAADAMTLAEIEDTLAAIKRRRESGDAAPEGKAMTPDEFEGLKEAMREYRRSDEVF